MFIDVFKNNGTEYLRLAESRRITNAKGVKVTSKKIILNIGPMSRFDDGKPEYIKRLKQSFKDGTPLISELSEYARPSDETEVYSIQFCKGEQECIGNPMNLASCVLDACFSALGFDELFASIKHSSKIQYDLQGIIRLLAFERLLNPSSKIAAMRQKDSYYPPLVKSSNDDNVYDALDVVYENRKQPIVQMGLFLDDNGIPISIEMFPGNTLDHLTLRTAMKNTVNDLDFKRFILVADRGMYNGTNMCQVIDSGNGYIVSKSIRKSKKINREWIINQDDYISESSEFKYKSRIVETTTIDEDGHKR